jgi:Tfp pilus assembly protein PilO
MAKPRLNPQEELKGFLTKMNEKNPYSAVLGVVAVLLLIDFLAVMRFQIKMLIGGPDSLGAKISSLSQEIKTAKTEIARMPQYQAELKQLSEKLKKINRNVKTKEEIPVIMENLSRVANANGVRIEQIMPNTAVTEPVLKNNDGQYFSIPIMIEAKSAYHDFGRFLNQLEREEGLLSMPSFAIAANPVDPLTHQVKLTINAIIFEPTKAKK